MLRGFMKIFGKMALILAGCILCGYFLLVCAYCIPTDKINNSVKQSAYILSNEGGYPNILANYNADYSGIILTLVSCQDSQLDNYTDALMLLTAAHEDDFSAYLSAILGGRSVTGEGGAYLYDSLIKIYTGDEEADTIEITYERYWHGYLIILKPLLYFFNISEIRYFNILFQMLLFTTIAVLLAQKKRTALVFPLLLSWIFLNPISTFMSLQYSDIFYLTFIQFIVFCVLENKYKSRPFWLLVHFMLAGACTSYFDLLTYPLVTLGLPLAFWITIQKDDNFQKLCSLLKCALAWGFGYAGMWAGKWLVGSIVSGENIFLNALKQAAYRTSNLNGGGEKISYLYVLRNQIYSLNTQAVIFFIAAFLLVLLWSKHRGLSVKTMCQTYAKNILIYAVIAVMPFIWYLVLSNHSYIHSFFTYRELAISLYAFLMWGLIPISDIDRISKKE